MNLLKKLLSDVFGILRVLGVLQAARWLGMVLANFPQILRERNLQCADHSMGEGPFRVRIPEYGVDFRVCGPGAMSGIREMYARDTYLHRGQLNIGPSDVVLDLGANMGNFTNLALAHGSAVRVVSVEPGRSLNEVFKKSVSLNAGFMERAQLVRGFIGLRADKQDAMLQDEQYEGAAWISEDELLAMADLSRVDFLKCDIEGGEFGLLHPDSRLLKMAKKIAIEVHHFAGDVDAFIAMLTQQGFEIKTIQRDPDGTATVLGARA